MYDGEIRMHQIKKGIMCSDCFEDFKDPSPEEYEPCATNHMTIKLATKRAIAKYGIQTCIQAYEMHKDGNGASTVSLSFAALKGNTNAGDAAINAGRDLKENGYSTSTH